MRHVLGVVVLSVLLQATSCGTTYQAAVEQDALSAEDQDVSTAKTRRTQAFYIFLQIFVVLFITVISC